MLKQAFKSGPELTTACLTCHTKAAHQVKQSLHWKWEYKHPETGQVLGKKNVINSFCGNVVSNEPRCTSCHVGYDWKDMNKPPPKADNKVDCVVCHDTTGTYSKWPIGAGHPLYEPVVKKGKTIMPPDLRKVAQSVGLPERENCGSCHFYGGGGDNVKHGDLSSALIAPDKHVDVHMAADGLNFACTTCHISTEHQIEGSRYSVNTHDDGKKLHGELPADLRTDKLPVHGKYQILEKNFSIHMWGEAAKFTQLKKFKGKKGRAKKAKKAKKNK